MNFEIGGGIPTNQHDYTLTAWANCTIPITSLLIHNTYMACSSAALSGNVGGALEFQVSLSRIFNVSTLTP